MIATALPITTIQRGIEAGKLNAKSIPVTTALKSLIVFSLFIIFLEMYSKNTQDATATAVTVKEMCIRDRFCIAEC